MRHGQERKMRSLILAFALTACAATGSPSAVTDEEHELTRELRDRVAGPPEDCVSATGSQGLRIVDSRTIVYGSGSTLWVSRLESACPALRPLNILIVDVQGGQYCRGDRVRGLEPGSTIAGPVCLLGKFTPYRPTKD
jgi:hypothetical protein